MENIYQAINGVMKDIGAVGKNKRNDQQKYMYRGIDDVMTALSPAIQEHGIFIIPEVLEQIREMKTGVNRNGQETTLLYSIIKVKYTFTALDGTSVTAVVMGEGMDSGDKATNKAMSAAYKYALLQTFCIPTEEMIDSEQDSPEVRRKPQAEFKPASLQTKINEVHTLCESLNVNKAGLASMYKLQSINDADDRVADSMLKALRTEVEKREAERKAAGVNAGDPAET